MAPPTNDNFSNAQGPLSTSLPGSASGTTFDATKEGTEPAFATNDQSVWFYFIPGSSGWYKFWVDAADIVTHNGQSMGIAIGTPTTLAGYTLSAVESYVAHPTSQSFAGFPTVAMFLTSGTTYYIKVWSNRSGSANSESVDFTLRWDSFSPPGNNNFASPTAVGSLPASLTVGTKDATMEASEPLINSPTYSAIQSRWYTFTAAAAGLHRVRLVKADFAFTGTHLTGVVDGIDQTPGIIYAQVFTDFVDTLAETTEANALAVNQIGETSSGDVVLSFVAPSAGTYYIRVGTPYKIKSTVSDNGYGFNDQVASTTMQVEVSSPPANNNFASPTALSTTLPGTLTGQTTFDSTQEATEPDVFSSGANIEQSVWYTFTPTVSGVYAFKIPLASAVYNGTNDASSGELNIGIWDETVLTDMTTANIMAQDEIFTAPSWSSPHDAAILVNLVSGTTYHIKVASGFGTTYNRSTCNFTLQWDIMPTITNDDFASAQAISGSSGSVDPVHTAGSTFQTGASEPPSMYWNGAQTQGTVWFDWTCPATGDYVFKIEGTEDTTGGSLVPSFDLAVWQGSSIGSLTKVCRSWIGSQNLEGRPWSQATAVGFHGISGQHYKIQVTNWNPIYNDAKLSWRTNTVTGDSTAAPASFPNGRTNNYGNDDSEPPPNFATILGGHDSWWFTDGQVGHVKWFKAVYSDTQTITIDGKQFDGLNSATVTSVLIGDVGLIVYKGANYGSLAVAKISGTTVNAAMMLSNGYFSGTGTDRARLLSLNTPGSSDGEDFMDVDVTAGDTVWIALFGLYDADYAGSDSLDAQQFELDLHVPIAAPANDNWQDVWDNDTFAYWLNYGKYPLPNGFFDQSNAVHRTGSTVGGTAEVGEGARAGFAATRSVWYYWFPDSADPRDWTLTVDSTVDCVLGVYDVDYPSGDLLALMYEDDDSGTGNHPQIVITPTQLFADGWSGDALAIVVDSKTEGAFDLYLSRELSGGTPPSNDNFASAAVISSLPFSASGTTVDADAEFDEPNAEFLSAGSPKDSVWYKYVATFNGQLGIKAACNSNNDDGYVYVDTWRGTSFANLVRDPEPPKSNKGFFGFGDAPAIVKQNALTVNVVSGQTYYIRVLTESGGSEDFTVYADVDGIYLDLQVSAIEEMHGTLIDSATILVDLQASGIDRYSLTTDAATLLLDLQPSGVEVKGFQYTDTGSIYVNLTAIVADECIFHLEPSWIVDGIRKWSWNGSSRRWAVGDTSRRWTWIEGEGQPQIC